MHAKRDGSGKSGGIAEMEQIAKIMHCNDPHYIVCGLYNLRDSFSVTTDMLGEVLGSTLWSFSVSVKCLGSFTSGRIVLRAQFVWETIQTERKSKILCKKEDKEFMHRNKSID